MEVHVITTIEEDLELDSKKKGPVYVHYALILKSADICFTRLVLMLFIMIITGYHNPLPPVVLAAESNGAARSDVSPTVIKPLIYYFVSRYSKSSRKKAVIIRQQLPIILKYHILL